MLELRDSVDLEIKQLGHEAGLAKRFLDDFIVQTRNTFLDEFVKSEPNEKEYRENLYFFLRFLEAFNSYMASYVCGAQGNVLIDEITRDLKQKGE